jgi:RNase adaptor protein for sRNA GlmZ degradation
MLLDLYSFGFRRSGIPQDPSEHGGGFVFDCRCLPNPGRYDAYKPQTGRDAAVANWLRKQARTEVFVQQVIGVVTLSVDDYMERGLARLMVSIGCTGGQHRSVFVSERLRAHFAQRTNLTVQLTHTEQAHWPTPSKRSG